MDANPIKIVIPIRQKTARINGVDVSGFTMNGDFWRMYTGDGEVHPVTNMIQEWLWTNMAAVPDIVWVLEGQPSFDDEVAAGESDAHQINPASH